MFTVTAHVKSNHHPDSIPVPMKWYKGESEAEVIVAVAQNLAQHDGQRFARVVSITVEIGE